MQKHNTEAQLKAQALSDFDSLGFGEFSEWPRNHESGKHDYVVDNGTSAASLLSSSIRLIM